MWVILPLALGGTIAAAETEEDISALKLWIEESGPVMFLDPDSRDERVRRIAEDIRGLALTDRASLRRLESSYQEALMFAVDATVYDSLSEATIEAVDDALETVFDLDDLGRSTEWEPLIYVYGFFNHDVTASDIRQVATRWASIPKTDRERFYPTYPHVIDALCKPLSMGPLAGGDTVEALDVALPLLVEQLRTSPGPGRRFHPPSHAAILLGPIYERWPEGTQEGATVVKHLGSRTDLVALLTAQLVGSQTDHSTITAADLGFYAYTGRYLANGLLRLDARSAVPVLRSSLEIYVDHSLDAGTVKYTERALAGLGETAQRRGLEARLANEGTRQSAIADIVWLNRNGQGECRAYAQGLLAAELGAEPEHALTAYYERELARLRDTR